MKVKPACYSPVPGTEFFEKDCAMAPELRLEPLFHNPAAAAALDYAPDICERMKRMAEGR
jgi:hypothetical protein